MVIQMKGIEEVKKKKKKKKKDKQIENKQN